MKKLQSSLILTLIAALCWVGTTPALAADDPPPDPTDTILTFLDPTKALTLTAKDLEEGLEIHIANRSTEEITLLSRAVGNDILATEDSSLTIPAAENVTVTFTLVPNPPEGVFSGFLVFSSPETGEVLYKTITVDTRTSFPPTAAAPDSLVILGGEAEPYTLTPSQDGPVRVPILNTGSAKAEFTAELKFLDPASGNLSSHPHSDSITLSGYEAADLAFDLGDHGFKPGSLPGVLVLKDKAGQWFLHPTVALNLPPDNLTDAAQLDLFTDDEGSLAFDGNKIISDTLHIPVLNKSDLTAVFTATITFSDSSNINCELAGNPDQEGATPNLPKQYLGEIHCPLDGQFKDRGQYAGYLIIRGEDNQWFTHTKVVLSVPSADHQVASSEGLSFLPAEEPININYSQFKGGANLQKITLVNKGTTTITLISAQVFFPNLVDAEGNHIQSKLQIPPFHDWQTLSPLETSSLPIQLPSEAPKPADGTYNGYLVLKTDQGPAMVIKSITLTVSEIDSNTPTVLTRAGTAIQSWFQDRFKTPVRFEKSDWALFFILLSILLVILLNLVRRLRLWWWHARGILGPVVIEEIAGKPALTAEMREHLAACGILPTASAPNTSIGAASFITIISESKLPEAAWIAKLLNYLRAYLRPRFGYTVSSVLTGDAAKPPVGITLQVKMTHSGRVKRVFSVQADTYRLAVEKAANSVFHYISGRPAALRRVPKWSRFPTPGSYMEFKTGQAYTQDQAYQKAISEYEESHKSTPFNALLRLHWGNTYELKQQYIEAMLVYLEAAIMWPYLYSFCYRIAILCSYADEFFNGQWKALPTSKKTLFLQLLNNKIQEIEKKLKTPLSSPLIDEDDPDSVDANTFLKVSIFFMEAIDREIRFWPMLGKWIQAFFRNLYYRIFEPARNLPGLAKYYWGYIPVWPWGYGRQFRRMVRLANFCTQVRAGDYIQKGVQGPGLTLEVIRGKVEDIARRPWNGSTTYYNTACFYALVYAREGGDPDYSPIVLDAMRYLKEANRSALYISPDWIKIDPDLKPLRSNQEFKALFDIPDKDPNLEAKVKEIKNKHYTLWLLYKEAQQQTLDWEKSPGKRVSREELIALANHQFQVWEDLAGLAADPTVKSRRELFWTLAMQKSNQDELLPDHKNSGFQLPQEKDLDVNLRTLNSDWQFVQQFAAPQVDTWQSRKANGALYLEHGKRNMRDVWTLWRQTEIHQWQYLLKKLEAYMKATTPKAKK